MLPKQQRHAPEIQTESLDVPLVEEEGASSSDDETPLTKESPAPLDKATPVAETAPPPDPHTVHHLNNPTVCPTFPLAAFMSHEQFQILVAFIRLALPRRSGSHHPPPQTKRRPGRTNNRGNGAGGSDYFIEITGPLNVVGDSVGGFTMCKRSPFFKIDTEVFLPTKAKYPATNLLDCRLCQCLATDKSIASHMH